MCEILKENVFWLEKHVELQKNFKKGKEQDEEEEKEKLV